MSSVLTALGRLSDGELVSRLKRVVTRERGDVAEVVAHLAEMDTRDIHLREGYASLYLYCRDVLRLSEWEAYNRIEVARTCRRFPAILDMLAEGWVHLTTIRLLGPHLTPENHRAVLESARGRSRTEVQEIVARLSPRPDVPASIRRLPATSTAPLPAAPSPSGPRSPAPPPAVVSALETPPQPGSPASDAMAIPPQALRSQITPLSPDRYGLHLTIPGGTLEKLRLAKEMLSHSVPSGDEAAIIDRALTSLLVELSKKKFADTPQPRSPRGIGRGSRTVPAAVQRAVWVRDLGRCAFVAASGHRCQETRFVEFHHVDPYALGGEASVDQIQLRCRRHNDYEARLYFGTQDRSRGELVPEQVRLSPSHSSPSRPTS